ncbi:phytoene desaturase family protein [Marinigracilibium pacificum]|uniref:NAD(P)/FAD-dependent oxidoreductase n=1 Tax=Marinigracilibium pacificum TaxID=2729599 RepID=A0A848J0R6_9BACT|nr:NAD(P)/FAD-dependent oxidoreductase [Marinigracilibium pacificum]NMM47879.1 NAD(P)/FAD-dependent oxidoreductase [Marinigracilibium pacificum]
MEEQYDVIIVGSGLGGLECGVILSREGYKVLVLEKNKQIGGNLQTFSRDKRIFDTGIHYIGGLDEGQNLNRYLKFMGIMDDLKLKRLDEDGFDLISFDGDKNIYPHAQGYERFIDSLLEYFPEEKKALVTYCEKIQEVCNSFPMYNLEKSNTDLTSMPYLNVSASKYISSITNNLKLQQVLAGSNLLYAGEADKTPLYVHALVVNSYIESAYRCINGSAQIARKLTRIILDNGGVVLKHAHVNNFGFKGKSIEYVELKDKRKFYCKNVISNIHPAVTLDMVDEGILRNAYKKRIQNLENSISVFILHAVLKEDKVNYFNHNLYHYADPDVWKGVSYNDDTWPLNYAVFTGATSKQTKYADTLTMMAYMKDNETYAWKDTYNVVSEEMDRGDAYLEFKEKKAEKLITTLERRMPGIKGSIDKYYTSTPLTYRDYIGDKEGSMYGIIKDYKDPLKTFISPRTKVPNLFLTGQNLNMHGVLGVTIGSVITCSEFLGNEYLMKKVKQAV